LALTYRLLEGNRRSLALVVVAALLSALAEAVALVIIARLAFGLATGDADVGISLGPLGTVDVAMEVLIAVAAGLVLFDIALQLFGTSLRTRLGQRVSEKYRTRLTRTYLGASWTLQSGERPGRLQEMVGSFVNTANGAVSQLTLGVVALVSLLAFMAIAVVVNVLAALAVAVAAIGLGLLLRPLRTATRRTSGAAARANLAVATDVSEASSHLLEIRIFGAEDAVQERLAEQIRDATRLDARRALLNALGPVVYRGLALLLMVAAVGLLYAADVSRLGAVGGVVLIMLRSMTYGQSLQSAYQTLHSVSPTLVILRDELARYEANAVVRGGEPVGTIGVLAFEDVSFEYQPRTPVLRDLSFVVEHGEVVGIVGPSGSGKSTMVQLLLRLRSPTTGVVLADGRDVSALDIDEWNDRIGFVPQDPVLFAGTVADNIRFYRDAVDDAGVERAAKLANLHDEVSSWREGYSTPVGERGGRLSGGQRQRLCIARALAEEPDVIVFDESTSALDVKSEGLVRDAMVGLAPRTTVFVIAHRLSTLTICDRIMVLLDGELHGFDEPTRLEATNPFYRDALKLSGLR
jgi:ABC-type multidrug transport system fused ATPase/permease subunit